MYRFTSSLSKEQVRLRLEELSHFQLIQVFMNLYDGFDLDSALGLVLTEEPISEPPWLDHEQEYDHTLPETSEEPPTAWDPLQGPEDTSPHYEE